MPSVRIRLPSGLVSLLLGLVLSAAPAQDDQDTAAAHPDALRASLSRLPLCFVENRGLYPDEVAFVIQGSDKTLYFAGDGVTIRLKDPGRDRAWVVKLVFVEARPDVVPRGEDRQAAVFSYFRGPEKNWKAGLATFSRVVYRDLWPGIDLVYRGTVNRLKYEFVVRPGADPGRIRLRYEGATRVHTTDRGALAVETPAGGFEDAPPAAWQEIEGRRSPVAMAYALARDGSYGFTLGDYDAAHALVLDPAVLVYCGFIGGVDADQGTGIAVDQAGNAYVTGSTFSNETTFPVKVGPDPTYNGGTNQGGDAFVAKVNAMGTTLIYCGFIGGAGADEGRDIAVDTGGNAYITGTTRSSEQTFPVKVGPDLTYNNPTNTIADAFVAKVDASGKSLVYCGYIGGINIDNGHGIAVDGSGRAYVTGVTNSTQQSFPVAVGPDLTFNGTSLVATDAFVARVNAAGTALDYCGYIGGSQNDVAYDVAVDVAGNAYVTGVTFSDQLSFPVTTGPDLTYNGIGDVFVAKVNASGTGLVYCGYIGGTAIEECRGIAVDAFGNAFVTGWTCSNEMSFPVNGGPDLTHNGGSDAFVAQVKAGGAALVYCGYIGGAQSEQGEDIAVDATGNAYVLGGTSSNEQTFPVTRGPDLTFNGITDAFVASISSGGHSLSYCGYIGGQDDENWPGGGGIAVDADGNAYVAAGTNSNEKTFPVKVGPDLTHNGNGILGGDVYVAKIAQAAFTASGAPRIGSQVVFSILSTNSAGLPYQVGTSFGTGPIPIDTRQLNLGPDTLLVMSVTGAWPQVFESYAGMLGQDGRAAARLHIPALSALVGLRLHTAFVTLDAAFPSGIKTISSTVSFMVVK